MKGKRAGHVARRGKYVKAYNDLVEKYEGNKPLTRPEHRWKNNIIYFCLFNDAVIKSEGTVPSDKTILNNELKCF